MTDIVLVHGLWADESSWSEVIPLLRAAGHRVLAVRLPLTTAADDVAFTREIIDRLPEPVVLVGWSYGGVVVSNAARDAPNVSALVYLAAFAPDQGESGLDILARFPSPLVEAVHRDEHGRLSIDPDECGQLFADDVPPLLAAELANAHRPAGPACMATPSGEPAWRMIPSWYLVAENDRVLLPEAQRWMATRMGAHTSSTPSSHSVPLSQPKLVAELIASAAEACS